MSLTIAYHTLIGPADPWRVEGNPESQSSLSLSVPVTVVYPDGTSDSLPALTAAIEVFSGLGTFDRTAQRWIGYTVQGSGVLNIIQESQLSSLTGTVCPLCWVWPHAVLPWQPYQTGTLTEEGPPSPDSGVPVIITPTNGTTGLDPDGVTTTYTAVTSGVDYEVQVDTSPTFPTPIIDATVAGLTYSIPASTLAGNQTYYERVRVISPFTSAWSPVVQFSTLVVVDVGVWNDLDDYVATGAKVLNPGSSPFTLMGWVKPQAGSAVIVSEIGSDNAQGEYQFRRYIGTNPGDIGKYQLLRRPTASSTAVDIYLSAAGASLDHWHHIAVVFDGSSAQFYIDGLAITTTHSSGTYTGAAATTTVLGSNEAGDAEYFWQKDMSDIRMYIGELTHDQIVGVYTSGLGDFHPVAAPTAWWKLNQTSGTSVTDSSGLSHTGTWHGSGSHWETSTYP